MRILSVVGARPNFMKIAPIHAELVSRGERPRLVHTGQHYDRKMSDVFFQQLDLPEPDVYLGVGSGSHAVQTAKIITAFEETLLAEAPDLVIVVGDVNSTLACTLVAAKLEVPVDHVEAGLRSFDRRMPEEINRIVTDRLAQRLFVTEPSGVANLRAEGADETRVHLVGNVMIDTLVRLRPKAEGLDVAGSLGLEPRGYAVATLHRPANVDTPEGAESITAILERTAEILPIVFPVHPRTSLRLAEFGLLDRVESGEGIHLLDPLGYLEFLSLMDSAAVMITDSGGIQEETTFLGVPCLTLRESTERPITVELGTNELLALEPEAVAARVAAIAAGETRRSGIPPLWDGRAAGRIADILLT